MEEVAPGKKKFCLLELKASKKKALMFNIEPCVSKGFLVTGNKNRLWISPENKSISTL